MRRVSVGDFRIDQEERRAIEEVLDIGWLSEGQKTHEFEKLPRGYSIYMKNIPIDIAPKYSEKELPAYVFSTNTCFGGHVLDNCKSEKIVVKGMADKVKYNFLKLYILLQ